MRLVEVLRTPKAGHEHVSERRDPKTLEEAYHSRDSAGEPEERDFCQEQAYALRCAGYQRRGIARTSSFRRRECRSAIEFSREMFFLEVADIAGRQGTGGEERVRQEAQRFAARLDKYDSPERPDLQPDPAGARVTELYRRNFLELRAGKSAGEACYLSRGIGSVGDAEFGSALEYVRRTGYPGRRSAYIVQRAALRIWDRPGGIILILRSFFASVFALVWAPTNIWGEAGAGTIFVVVGLAAVRSIVK